MSLTTRKMSDRHEEYLADLFDGRMTRGSGSSWVDQTDGKHRLDPERAYPFAWDGKSTLAKSISIPLKTWQKLCEQTEPGKFPMLPLRYYGDERLTRVLADLVVLDVNLLADILEDAELGAQVRREREGQA